MPLGKSFVRYVSLNAIAMLGVSLYILADTFFISYFLGPLGLASLSIVLPMFFLFMTGPGMMLGIGAAAHFSIALGRRRFREANRYLHTALLVAILYGLVLTVLYFCFQEEVCHILGANEETFANVKAYLGYLMLFTVFFVTNQVVVALLRNDGSPNIAMAATLVSNFVNIFFDWFFMGPCHMGMAGASLATGFSPLSAMLIALLHLRKSDREYYFRPFQIDFRLLPKMLVTGLPSYATEGANGLTTLAFNRVILGLLGTIGISAYSIVVNTAFIVIYLLVGIAQGVQPLVSINYGRENVDALHRLWRWGIWTMLGASAVVIAGAFLATAPIIGFFNHEGDQALAALAGHGLRLYYCAFLFMGVNLLAVNVFAAIADGRSSLLISFLRALVLPIPVLLSMAALAGMEGVWLTLTVVEGLTLFAVIWRYRVAYRAIDQHHFAALRERLAPPGE